MSVLVIEHDVETKPSLIVVNPICVIILSLDGLFPVTIPIFATPTCGAIILIKTAVPAAISYALALETPIVIDVVPIEVIFVGLIYVPIPIVQVLP